MIFLNLQIRILSINHVKCCRKYFVTFQCFVEESFFLFNNRLHLLTSNSVQYRIQYCIFRRKVEVNVWPAGGMIGKLREALGS